MALSGNSGGGAAAASSSAAAAAELASEWELLSGALGGQQLPHEQLKGYLQAANGNTLKAIETLAADLEKRDCPSSSPSTRPGMTPSSASRTHISLPSPAFFAAYDQQYCPPQSSPNFYAASAACPPVPVPAAPAHGDAACKRPVEEIIILDEDEDSLAKHASQKKPCPSSPCTPASSPAYYLAGPQPVRALVPVPSLFGGVFPAMPPPMPLPTSSGPPPLSYVSPVCSRAPATLQVPASSVVDLIDSDSDCDEPPTDGPLGRWPKLLGEIKVMVLVRQTEPVGHSIAAGEELSLKMERLSGAEPGLLVYLRKMLVGRLDATITKFLWPLLEVRKIRVRCTVLDPRVISRFNDEIKVSLMPMSVDPRERPQREKERGAWHELLTLLFNHPCSNRCNRPPVLVDLCGDHPDGDFALERVASFASDAQQYVETLPASTLKIPLYRHQRQGLTWMLQREQTIEGRKVLHPLYKAFKTRDGTPFYFSPKEGGLTFNFPASPPPVEGGILADDMGLGKTISATLVICPVSMVGVWQKELLTHVEPKTLTVELYYGTCRNKDSSILANYDVVITSYPTVCCEWKSQCAPDTSDADSPATCKKPKVFSPLFAIDWHRIILDEAHAIRGKRTVTAGGVFALEARKRWCLTGTPIHNSLDDLYSLLHFLRAPLFSDERMWRELVSKPHAKKDQVAIARLNALLQPLMLRRTKDQTYRGEPLVVLPPKSVELVELEFSPEEQRFYSGLASETKRRFDTLLSAGTVMQNYANVLEMLLRLRQACDHPKLVPSEKLTFVTPELQLAMSSFVQFAACRYSPVVAAVVSERFAAGGAFECAICSDAMDRPCVSPCAHIFCRECLLGREATALCQPQCPVCQASYDPNQLLLLPPELTPAPPPTDFHNGINSAKLTALIAELKALPPDCKAVVFSQWTSMLNIMETALTSEGFQCARFDGGMTQPARQKALCTFEVCPNTRVMLLSLRAGGLGLTLTCANYVFVMDPWWCPAAEQQAIDRVHRLGQKRPVVVKRFVVKGTVEQRILQLQESKLLLANDTLATPRDLNRFRVEDLRMLFSV